VYKEKKKNKNKLNIGLGVCLHPAGHRRAHAARRLGAGSAACNAPTPGAVGCWGDAPKTNHPARATLQEQVGAGISRREMPGPPEKERSRGDGDAARRQNPRARVRPRYVPAS